MISGVQGASRFRIGAGEPMKVLPAVVVSLSAACATVAALPLPVEVEHEYFNCRTTLDEAEINLVDAGFIISAKREKGYLPCACSTSATPAEA